jgi:hypothetical protein
VSRATCPIVIHLSSREPIAGRGSFIVLEAADEATAIGIAQKLARLTGRRVTVRDAQRSLIEAIPRPASMEAARNNNRKIVRNISAAASLRGQHRQRYYRRRRCLRDRSCSRLHRQEGSTDAP